MLKLHDILVSIIIPVYNAENTILRCLESIFLQTYENLEIIVVDDGSIDKTLQILKTISDKRLKIISKDNGGVSTARNKGLDIASGEFIAFIDSDDFVEKDFIYFMLKSAIKNSADIVVCDVVQIINKKKFIYEDIGGIVGSINSFDYLKLLMTDKNSQGWVCNKFFRKEILNNIVFNEDIKYSEDKLFLIFAILKSKKIYKLNKALYNYDLVYKNFSPLHYQNGLKIDKILKEFFIKSGLYENFKNEIFFIKITNYMFLVVNKDKFKKNEYKNELKGLASDIKNIVKSPFFKELNIKFRVIFKVLNFLKNITFIYCFLSVLNSRISKEILRKFL